VTAAQPSASAAGIGRWASSAWRPWPPGGDTATGCGLPGGTGDVGGVPVQAAAGCGCLFGTPSSTWSRNVVARGEFPYIAEIAPDSVLSCLPRAGCPPLGTWGWTAWATTNGPTYRTGFSRAAGPRARPGQIGTPPQQTKTGPSPRPARRQIQVRQAARTVWPGVTCVQARGLRAGSGPPRICVPAPTDARCPAARAGPACERAHCPASVPEAGNGVGEK
jgi:hypothetical protein